MGKIVDSIKVMLESKILDLNSSIEHLKKQNPLDTQQIKNFEIELSQTLKDRKELLSGKNA